jgi:NAD(P)-dependent dehydrogenase (short-subunit alcohol dehydrogenase family)
VAAHAQFVEALVSISSTARMRKAVATHSSKHRRESIMILQDKVAVIYGAAGAIGGAVARAFASEGACVVLTGRAKAPLKAVAKDIVAAGGSAETAEVDALDEQAVDGHLQSLIERTGRVDISFNAIGIPDAKILGVPLVELDVERFSLPIAAYTRSYFLTARLAARHMIRWSTCGPTACRRRARCGRSSTSRPRSWA